MMETLPIDPQTADAFAVDYAVKSKVHNGRVVRKDPLQELPPKLTQPDLRHQKTKELPDDFLGELRTMDEEFWGGLLPPPADGNKLAVEPSPEPQPQPPADGNQLAVAPNPDPQPQPPADGNQLAVAALTLRPSHQAADGSKFAVAPNPDPQPQPPADGNQLAGAPSLDPQPQPPAADGSKFAVAPSPDPQPQPPAADGSKFAVAPNPDPQPPANKLAVAPNLEPQPGNKLAEPSADGTVSLLHPSRLSLLSHQPMLETSLMLRLLVGNLYRPSRIFRTGVV